MQRAVNLLSVAGMLFLAGCSQWPTGPSVLALPGADKTFQQFRQDDILCRQYAFGQVGGVTANQAAVDHQVDRTIVGSTHEAAEQPAQDGGYGASTSVGAGLGVVGAAGIGIGEGVDRTYADQHTYDEAYFQCMFARGQSVPVFGRYTEKPENRSSRPRPSQ